MKANSYFQLVPAFGATYLLYQPRWGLNALLLSALVLLLLALLKRLAVVPALLFATAGVLFSIYGSVLARVLHILLLAPDQPFPEQPFLASGVYRRNYDA